MINAYTSLSFYFSKILIIVAILSFKNHVINHQLFGAISNDNNSTPQWDTLIRAFA